jgi:hypothetical protein
MAENTFSLTFLLFFVLGRGLIGWRNMSCPSHTGLGLVLRGFARNSWDIDEMAATRALDLSPGELLATSHTLVAVGTFKLEFAHR